jgi:probable F420-dependent oxidoreductase
MKVGVNLLNFGPAASPESLLRWARMAEALGYHFVMISDHVAMTPDVMARYPAPFYDPFLSLGWLAGKVRRLALGTTVVILPYRHPLEVARLTANLDTLSGGRFIFGVGVGWARQEFEALGVPFERRGAMADEALEIITRCWTEDVVTHAGRFFAFRDVRTAPRPVRRPPIWVGGGSDAALRRAVRHGDAWHPIRITLPWLREALARLEKIAAQEGRPVPALCPRIRLCLTPAPMPEDGRVAGHGTIEQVHADFQALAALGARYVLLDTYLDDPEATRHHEVAWAMFAALAERVLDLRGEAVRAVPATRSAR